MTPAKETPKATLVIYRNLPWSITMRQVNADGQPINLTGWAGKLVVRSKLDDTGVPLATFQTSDATMVLGNGTIQLKVPDAATINAWNWTEGVGHLVLKSPTDLPQVQGLFAFNVKPSTTDTPL